MTCVTAETPRQAEERRGQALEDGGFGVSWMEGTGPEMLKAGKLLKQGMVSY